MHLDEIYASEARRDAVIKTIDLMNRLNRNKRITTEKEKAEEQREIDRKNEILSKKIEKIDRGQYVGRL